MKYTRWSLSVVGVLCLAGWALVADEPAPRSSLPEGMRGFSGLVAATVIAKEPGTVTLKIERIIKTWEGNKADNPASAAGKTAKVGAPQPKGEEGKTYAALQARFINSLKVGEKIEVEVAHRDGDQLVILELSKEQRERANAKE